MSGQLGHMTHLISAEDGDPRSDALSLSEPIQQRLAVASRTLAAHRGDGQGSRRQVARMTW
jgi:hypothetical protein